MEPEPREHPESAPPLTRESQIQRQERHILPWVAALCGVGGLALGLGIGLIIGVAQQRDAGARAPERATRWEVPVVAPRLVAPPAPPAPGPLALRADPDDDAGGGACERFTWRSGGGAGHGGRWFAYGPGCDPAPAR